MQQLRSRGLALVLAGILSTGMSLPAWSQQNSEFIGSYRVAQQSEQKTLAVVDFENHTGDAGQDHLKRGIAESLMTKLARRTELTLVERSQLDKAIKELGFGQSVYADAGKAKEVGKMLNADYLVTGDVVKAGNRFEINVRMIDVETAKVLVSESYAFQSENDILVAVDYLSLLIPRKLNLYVSDRELEMVKSQLRGRDGVSAQSNNDMSWIWWAVGAAVVVGAGIAVAVVLARPTQNITQCVGPNCGTSTDTSNLLRPEDGAFQMPLISF